VIFAALIQSASSFPASVSALESSISALESAISALESAVKSRSSSLVPLEFSVFVFTFLVAVGVVMELWVIRYEWRDNMEEWALAHFGLLRSPGRPSKTKLRVEIGSVLLITIGVMGELGVGIKIESINSELRGIDITLRSTNADLRSKSDRLLALVTQQAGDAATSAEAAKVSAARTGQLAAQAEADSQSAQQYAAELRSETVAGTLVLAASASGITLRPLLFNAVRYFKPANVDIQYEIGARPEIGLFTHSLKAALAGFGWHTSETRRMMSLDAGVTILNKWVSQDRERGTGMLPALEIDPSFMSHKLEKSFKGITKDEAERLSFLTFALDARLRETPGLDENSIIIIVN
jgi:hypothetical protein